MSPNLFPIFFFSIFPITKQPTTSSFPCSMIVTFHGPDVLMTRSYHSNGFPLSFTPAADEMQVGGYYLSELQLYVRLGCEAVTLLGSLAYLVGAANEARFQGAQMFVENLVSEGAREYAWERSCVCVCVLAREGRRIERGKGCVEERFDCQKGKGKGNMVERKERRKG